METGILKDLNKSSKFWGNGYFNGGGGINFITEKCENFRFFLAWW